MPPLEAALKGARQIGFTIVSLTVSLIAVLIPLLFMGGIVGRLFREFAVTLAIAIGVSALLSLTLTAMMGGPSPAPRSAQTPGRLARSLGARPSMRWCASTTVACAGCCATSASRWWPPWPPSALTVLLAWLVPKGFFPQQDTGLLVGVSEAPPSISFPAMMDRQRAVADVVRADPDVQAVASFIGADGTNPTSTSGRLSITLKARHAAQDRRRRHHRPARAPAAPKSRASRSTCSRCRTCRSTRGRAARSSNSRSKTPIPSELDVWAPRVLGP